ncbi:MAG: 4Fe-4S cluster-binding domain-containing protein [Treponemataceae bacterium]
MAIFKTFPSVYSACGLCDRSCSVDRTAGGRGFCGETEVLRIAVASIHRGEEPPITGLGGSGTIFVTGCTLHCSFCQNYQISREGMGAPVNTALFAEICLELERRGAENINIVTGSHAAFALSIGLDEARRRGLSIPALWNSSAYERVAAIDLAADRIQVYLPDLKTLDSTVAERYFKAHDYPEVAKKAILRMAELRPLSFVPARGPLPPDMTEKKRPEVLVSGVIMRHLVLPDQLEDTRNVLRWFADKLQGKALLSLMTQYTPVRSNENADLPDRFIGEKEYQSVIDMLEVFDIEDGFYQELVVADDWLPDFERVNPFSSELSVPVWHWKSGFVK